VRDRTDHGTNSTDAIWGRTQVAGSALHDDQPWAPALLAGPFFGLESGIEQTAIPLDGKLMPSSLARNDSSVLYRAMSTEPRRTRTLRRGFALSLFHERRSTIGHHEVLLISPAAFLARCLAEKPRRAAGANASWRCPMRESYGQI
jgi:hypothetical protein